VTKRFDFRERDAADRQLAAGRPAERGPKIIVQYRAKGARVYELESNGAVVAVRICEHGVDEAIGDRWHVDAQSDSGGASQTVDGWGPTAAAALKQVARAWDAHHPVFTAFEW
jgi:hypothetical protein